MQQPTSQHIAHSTSPPLSPQSKSSKQMDPSQSSKTHDEALLLQLRLQIEYYFSPQNLARDNFLNSLLSSRDHFGAVPVATISSFPKVKEIYASWLAGRFVPAFSAAPASPLTVGAAIRGSNVVHISADGHWLMPVSYPVADKTGSQVTSPTVSPTSFDSVHSQAVLAGPTNGSEHQLASRDADDHQQPVVFGKAYPIGAANVVAVPHSVSVPSDPSARIVREEMKPLPHGPVFGPPYMHAYAPYGNGPYQMGMGNDPQVQFAGRPFMEGPQMPPSPSPVPPNSPSKANGMQAHSASPGWTSHMVGQLPPPGNIYYGPPNQHVHFHREPQEYAPHPGRFAFMDHQHVNQYSPYYRPDQENMMNGAFATHPPVFVDMSNPDSVSHYDGGSLTNEQLHHYHQHQHSHHAPPSKNHRSLNIMGHSHNSLGSFGSNRGRNPRPGKMKGSHKNVAGPSNRGRKNYNNRAKSHLDHHGSVNVNENQQGYWNDSYNSASSLWYDSEGHWDREYAIYTMNRDQSHGPGSYEGPRKAHRGPMQRQEDRHESFQQMTASNLAHKPPPKSKKAEVASVNTAPSVQSPKREKSSSNKALGSEETQSPDLIGNGDTMVETASSAETPKRGKPSLSKALDGKHPRTPDPEGKTDGPMKSGFPQGLPKPPASPGKVVLENAPGDVAGSTAAPPSVHAPESHAANSSPARRLFKKRFSKKVGKSVPIKTSAGEVEVSDDSLLPLGRHSKNQRQVRPERKPHGTSTARIPMADATALEESSQANQSESFDPDAANCTQIGEAFKDLSLQSHEKKQNNRNPRKPFKNHRRLTLLPVDPSTRGERLDQDTGGQGKKSPRKGTASASSEKIDQQSTDHEV